MDEKSQVQALDRTAPTPRPGLAARRTHDYVRHGTAIRSSCASWTTAIGRFIDDHHDRCREHLSFQRTAAASAGLFLSTSKLLPVAFIYI